MRIESIVLRNFRCFGDEPTKIGLSNEVTALIGSNGTGKTALLIALSRLFGVTQDQRTICRSDFYLPPGTLPEDTNNRSLYIEAVFGFPELEEGAQDQSAIPPTFNQMVVSTPGASPFCRVRLESNWTDDGTADGSIEQTLYWITTSEDAPPDDKKLRMTPQDRVLIQVHYIPATRDPSSQLKYASGAHAGRLLRAISWAQDTRDKVQEASLSILDIFDKEQAIRLINELIQTRWSQLNDDQIAANAKLRFLGAQFYQVIRSFAVNFQPADVEQQRELNDLSDGQQSLFYLSLVAAVFDVEHRITHSAGSSSVTGINGSEPNSDTPEGEEELSVLGFERDRLRAPALTIFALEEPENHLAPHLLARVIDIIRSLASSGGAQALFSSHSPALLSRISPEEIRHFRLKAATRTTMVRKIILPDSPEDAAKYVREAVKAYPELYFAKFVILAEGPSEEVVIPKLATCSELELDKCFICVVPLGGRHVNHLWRLLSDLEIPFVSLLDLDCGREGGGWARIKYACEQLLSIGVEAEQLLSFNAGDANISLSQEELTDLHNREITLISEFKPWLNHLEDFGVFFSAPLDLDMSMLQRFPTAYTNTADGSPNFPPAPSKELDSYIHNAISAVIGSDENSIALYSPLTSEKQRLFAWYRYLFLNHSKPATHLQAVSSLDSKVFREKAPEALKRLLSYCHGQIKS